jgi:hypothetical protein
MNKKIAILLGGAAALGLSAQSQAVPIAPQGASTTTAQSYADLLSPIPNAAAALEADDARLAQEGGATVQLARYHHHHHHHHHHHGFFRGYYGGGPYYASPYGCYWTWGRPYWNGFRWVRPRVRVCN